MSVATTSALDALNINNAKHSMQQGFWHALEERLHDKLYRRTLTITH